MSRIRETLAVVSAAAALGGAVEASSPAVAEARSDARAQAKFDACQKAANLLFNKAKQWPGIVIMHQPKKPGFKAHTYQCPKGHGVYTHPDDVLDTKYDGVIIADPLIAKDHGRTYLIGLNQRLARYALIDVQEEVDHGSLDFYAYRGVPEKAVPIKPGADSYYIEVHPEEGKGVARYPNIIDAFWAANRIHPKLKSRDVIKGKTVPRP